MGKGRTISNNQSKPELGAYYDKREAAADGVHTRPMKFLIQKTSKRQNPRQKQTA